jgi:hypothetical protein
MQEAIKRAIEGGYIPKEVFLFGVKGLLDISIKVEKKYIKFNYKTIEGGSGGSSIKIDAINSNRVLLDPEFWKCVGRSEDWGSKCRELYYERNKH